MSKEKVAKFAVKVFVPGKEIEVSNFFEFENVSDYILKRIEKEGSLRIDVHKL